MQEEIDKVMSAYGGLGGTTSSSIQTGIPLIDNLANGAKSIWDKLSGGSSSDNSSSSSSKTYSGQTSSGKSYTVDTNGNITGLSAPLFKNEEEEVKNHIPRFRTGGRTGDLGNDGKLIIADSNEVIFNEDDTKQLDKNTLKLDEMYNWIKSSGTIVSQLSSQYENMGNYTMPSLGTDLNNLTNGVTNNNSTNNTNNSPISMSVSIINEKGAETFTEQKLFKAMSKWQREQGRTYR